MTGLSYYQLAYYPSSESWKEGFHRIAVKTTRAGVNLSFRRGYYTLNEKPIEPGPKSIYSELKQAACDDVMTATLTSIDGPVRRVWPDR
jgi:hypothetical protein